MVFFYGFLWFFYCFLWFFMVLEDVPLGEGSGRGISEGVLAAWLGWLAWLAWSGWEKGSGRGFLKVTPENVLKDELGASREGPVICFHRSRHRSRHPGPRWGEGGRAGRIYFGVHFGIINRSEAN